MTIPHESGVYMFMLNDSPVYIGIRRYLPDLEKFHRVTAGK